MDEWLTDQLGVPVARLDCGALLGSEGAAAAVPCGLAGMSGAPTLDLRPRASRQRRRVLQAATLTWQALAAAALAIWLGIGWWQVRSQGAARVLKAREAEWKALQPVVTLQEAIRRHTRLARGLVEEQGVPLLWFHRLAEGFPRPVRLTRLTISASQVVSLTGQAQAREQIPAASVSELTLWLRQAGVCDEVELRGTRPVTEDGTLAEFELTCRLARRPASGEPRR